MSRPRLGRPRRIRHSVLVAFAKRHPELTQAQIAAHFHTSQGRVSAILCAAGASRGYRGRVGHTVSGETRDKLRIAANARALKNFDALNLGV